MKIELITLIAEFGSEKFGWHQHSLLLAGNVSLDEKLPDSCGTVGAFKEAKVAWRFQ